MQCRGTPRDLHPGAALLFLSSWDTSPSPALPSARVRQREIAQNVESGALSVCLRPATNSLCDPEQPRACSRPRSLGDGNGDDHILIGVCALRKLRCYRGVMMCVLVLPEVLRQAPRTFPVSTHFLFIRCPIYCTDLLVGILFLLSPNSVHRFVW